MQGHLSEQGVGLKKAFTGKQVPVVQRGKRSANGLMKVQAIAESQTIQIIDPLAQTAPTTNGQSTKVGANITKIHTLSNIICTHIGTYDRSSDVDLDFSFKFKFELEMQSNFAGLDLQWPVLVLAEMLYSLHIHTHTRNDVEPKLFVISAFLYFQ